MALALLVTSIIGFVAPAGASAPPGGHTDADPLGQITPVAYGFTATVVAAGPDGRLWVATTQGAVWRFATSGEVVDRIGPDLLVSDLVAGSDGNMWVTSRTRDAIGMITPAGAVTWFTDPTVVDPAGIVAGPDGALWFANAGSDSIGRITTDGAITAKASANLDRPVDLAFGPDGHVWIANQSVYPDNGTIAEMDGDGVVTTYGLDGLGSFGVNPGAIVAGPDGKLWFTAGFGGTLHRITTDGTIDEIEDAIGLLRGLSVGPDGNVWVTDFGNWDPLSPPYNVGSVLRVTSAGVVDRFATLGNGPVAIAPGPDGNLWFVNGGKLYHHPPGAPASLGRITTAGTVSDFRPDGLVEPNALAFGPDGNVWVVGGAGTVASVDPDDGAVTNHDLPVFFVGDIVLGPDGNLWSVGGRGDAGDGFVARTTPAGVTDLFDLGPGVSFDPQSITSGPDGNLWVRELASSIARVTPDGVITRFEDPAIHVDYSGVPDIVAGPDGNVWFANVTSFGRITPAGVVTTFTPPSGPVGVRRLAFDPAGNLWFSDDDDHAIGRRAPDGTVVLWPDARIGAVLDLAVAPDGNSVWFTNAATVNPNDHAADAIGRLSTDGAFSFFTTTSLRRPIGIVPGPDGNLWFTDGGSGSVLRIGTDGTGPSAPSAPEAVTAAVLGTRATVSWSAPLNAGTAPVTSYAVTAAPGGSTCTATAPAQTCAVPGLTVGETYRFTVRATSSAGTGVPSSPSAPLVARFVDVPAGAPFDADITWLASRHITTGSPDGTFRPAVAVDRQSMAAFLYRASGSPNGPTPPCSTKPFVDVAVGAPFCGEIAWLKATGITGGYGDGTFRPSTPVSRGAMAAFLYRFHVGSGAVPSCELPAPFTDVAVGAPFCAEIGWMKASGLSTGYGDGTYRPTAAIARQAMAAFLHRLDQLP